jgi:hypothetical protein
VRHRPRERGDRVVGGGRERVLGRLAVLDREHVHAGVAAQHAAGLVVRVEVADDEPAAVQEQQQRMRAARLGRDVVAAAQAPGGTVDLEVADRAHRGRTARRRARLGADVGPCALGRHVGVRRHAEALAHVQQQLHLGVQRLAVDDDRAAAGETHLRARRQRGEQPRTGALGAFTRPAAVGTLVYQHDRPR